MNSRMEKLLNLPGYQRVTILILVMLVLGALFYYSFYQSQLEQHARLLTQRDAATVKLKKNQKIANNFSVYKAEFEKMQVQLDEALTELPLEREIPTLLSNVANLARDEGLEIVEFKPAKELVKGFYAEVPVNLKLAGSYHQAGAFFDAVSRMERIVNIQGLGLGGAKNVGGRTELKIDCRAITFRFVESPPENAGTKKGGR